MYSFFYPVSIISLWTVAPIANKNGLNTGVLYLIGIQPCILSVTWHAVVASIYITTIFFPGTISMAYTKTTQSYCRDSRESGEIKLLNDNYENVTLKKYEDLIVNLKGGCELKPDWKTRLR